MNDQLIAVNGELPAGQDKTRMPWKPSGGPCPLKGTSENDPAHCGEENTNALR